ncbi:MAG: helix-turn-helix transcriptional regulator [Clostridia bacterium]|nr:helix-turn-helix transcriptional regulator [Clostridia bacterium]
MTNQNFENLSMVNMEILTFDDIVLTPSWHAENVNSPFTRIYLVTDGVGYLRQGTTIMKMTAGNVYIIPAGISFSHSCEDGFSKIFFHISLKQPNGYDAFSQFDRCLSFADEEGVQLIRECFRADSVLKIMQIRSYLHALICRCLTQLGEMKISRYSDKLKKIQAVIEQNLSMNLTVEQIANELYISPVTVHKIFKEEMGIPIGKYIDDYVMFHTEFEVRQGTLSIREISEKYGFCDQFYFSRRFSQKYGMSPMRYRKEQQYKKD